MQGYASAKSGILGLTRAQAVSLDKRVRVNTVLPGWIVTPGSQARLTQDIHDWHLTGKLLNPHTRGLYGRRLKVPAAPQMPDACHAWP